MIEQISKEEFDKLNLESGEQFTLELYGTMQIDDLTKEASNQTREGYVKNAKGEVISVILF